MLSKWSSSKKISKSTYQIIEKFCACGHDPKYCLMLQNVANIIKMVKLKKISKSTYQIIERFRTCGYDPNYCLMLQNVANISAHQLIHFNENN